MPTPTPARYSRSSTVSPSLLSVLVQPWELATLHGARPMAPAKAARSACVVQAPLKDTTAVVERAEPAALP